MVLRPARAGHGASLRARRDDRSGARRRTDGVARRRLARQHGCRRCDVHRRRLADGRDDEQPDAAADERRQDRGRPLPEPRSGARARAAPGGDGTALMPDPVDLDLRALTARRREVDALDARRTALRVDLDSRTEELERLRREGRAGAAVERAERRVAELVAARDDVNERRGRLLGELHDLADGLVTAVDEALAVTALDGEIPVALLPVRIETRFAPDQRSL